MSDVRAKFTVTGVLKNGTKKEKHYSVTMQPVVGGSKENDNFYKWTPGGEITLSTINEAAGEKFEVGEDYYIDFTKAPAPEDDSAN